MSRDSLREEYYYKQGVSSNNNYLEEYANGYSEFLENKIIDIRNELEQLKNEKAKTTFKERIL